MSKHTIGFISSASSITKYSVVIVALWTLLILSLAIENWWSEDNSIRHMAQISAEQVLAQDLLFRRWNASHGGVYVPLTEDTPANPHLEFIEDRVVETTSGKLLTLINPAYMTRQVQELKAMLGDSRAHITSLNPIRLNNAPTEWERVALESFEQGELSYADIISSQGKDYYFLMKPLLTETGCLTCHANQGYKEGDIRGGLSAAIPMQPLWEIKNSHLSNMILSHGLIYIIGLVGIGFGSKRIRRQTNKRISAEKAILKNQYFLEKAQELGQIGTWELDIPSNVLSWTDENCRIFGVPPGTVATYAIFMDKVYPEDRDYVNDEWNAATQGKPYDVEHRLLVDGVIKWVRQKADITYDSEGRAIYAIGFTQDVTELKKSVTAMLESEDRFRALFEKAPISYQSLDESGDLIEANDTFCSLLGYQKEEVLGKNFSEFLHSDSLETFQENFPIFKRRGFVKNVEFKLKKKDGDFVDILLDGRVGHNEDGSFRQTHCVFQDVSEQKEMEAALVEAELQYRELVEITSNIITRVDLEGKILYVNPVAEHLYGITPKDCIGKSALDFVHPDDFDATKKWITGLPNNDNEHSNFENRQVNALTGTVRWILWTTDMEKNKAGNWSVINSVGRDITERKEIEVELKKREYFFRETQRAALIGSYQSEFSPNDIWVTSEVCDQIFGMEPDYDKTVNGWVNLLHPDSADEMLRYVTEDVIGKNIPFNKEYKIIRRSDGETRWVLGLGETITDENGVVTGLIGTIQDVTERKQAEEKVAESENRYRSLFETSIDGICSLDARGNFIEANDAARKLLGYSQEEFTQLNIKDIVFEADRKKSESYQERLKTEGFYKGYQGRVVSKDGQVSHVEVSSIAVFKDGEYNGSHDIVRDVTDRILLQDRHRTIEDQLRQSQKLEAVGTMVGGIAHELNNVLQSIFLYGGLVKNELPEDQELHSNMELLLRDGERAREIVKQILTFSRKSKVELQPQLLQNLIDEALAIERASLPPNIRIEKNIDQSCGPVLCDKTHIHQIIINLCNNANHAMANSDGSIIVELKPVREQLHSSKSMTDMVELTVADTGHGMDPETLEKVFDPFYTTKKVGEGTGLGLSVVHGIIEMMNGVMSVSSEPEKGTSFRILLPVTDSQTTSSEISKPSHDIHTYLSRILLVEDEENIRLATQEVLSELGFKVDGAADGEQALAIFNESRGGIDLIITDQSMPNMSGEEFTLEVRKTGSDIPILLSSGQLGIDDKQGLQDAGISAFLQKPWTADELLLEIEKLIK